ncbi:MAG TPA: IS1595 family transposase [Acidimicrobiia bacterium]|nr:IS1595 family transposase [Acidimicrobiia bacterium]
MRYFSDEDVCIEYVARLRWPNGPVCPACGGTEIIYLASRRVWKCKAKDCKKQFSVKKGTIFEQSPLGLDKWLPGLWLIANSKNGVSSHEVARALGITQKSARHLLHRCREALRDGTFELLDGTIEVDETFIGGKVDNKHASKRPPKGSSIGGAGKTIVVGARQRGGKARARVVPDRTSKTLMRFVTTNVDPGAQVYTDEASAYFYLRWDGYKHATVTHSKGEYVRGSISTNGVENLWSLLKRSIHGTYVQVAPEHLSRYVDERTFAYNLRERTDLERFETALAQSVGRRLTWAQLTET